MKTLVVGAFFLVLLTVTLGQEDLVEVTTKIGGLLKVINRIRTSVRNTLMRPTTMPTTSTSTTTEEQVIITTEAVLGPRQKEEEDDEDQPPVWPGNEEITTETLDNRFLIDAPTFDGCPQGSKMAAGKCRRIQ